LILDSGANGTSYLFDSLIIFKKSLFHFLSTN